MVFFWAASVFASPFETAVTKAMQTLSVTKGDPRLLLLTDAPYVTLDGQNALPYLGQAQELNGCTVGRGNPALLPAAPIPPPALHALS